MSSSLMSVTGSSRVEVRRSAFRALLLLLLRTSLGWIFLWASIHHYGDHVFVAKFLEHTGTFHHIYSGLAQAPLVSVVGFIVEFGQILIAGSLILGAFFRAGTIAGAILMIIYWTANMNFPYIASVDSFIVDEHFIFALVLVLLGSDGAGRVWGLDRVLSRIAGVRQNALLRWCTR